MSTTIDFTTVTNAIAALSISGVTVLDVNQLPDTIGLDDHVLAPNPGGFISDVSLVPSEMSQQKNDLFYTLHYRYYHCKIQTNGLFSVYANLLSACAAILLAFSSDDTLAGAMNNTAPVIDYIGGVQDMANQNYHGFDISIRIQQFLEV